MVLEALPAPLAVARPLSWLVVVGFLVAFGIADRYREQARYVAVATWVLFGAFWLVLVPHFVFEQRSIVEGVGAMAAVPLSVHAGYLLWTGRDSLFLMTGAVGLMGLIYLPFSYLPLVEHNPVRQWIIETVAAQTDVLLGAVGVEPELVRGTDYVSNPGANQDYQYLSTFYFEGNTRPITYTIIIACTGLGSMAIFAGAVLAVRAPMRRKARALAIAVPIIYAANLVRNVFIATMFGEQHMQWFPGLMMGLFGVTDPQLVSFYWADRIIAQFGSVIALVVIGWLVVREVPELVGLVEDGIYVATRHEVDLHDAVGLADRPKDD